MRWNCTKRLFAVLAVYTILPFAPALFGEDYLPFYAEPYSDVYFSYSLEEFNQLLNSGREDLIPPAALFVIKATITNLVILDATPENYYVDIEIMDAAWSDSRTLRTFGGVVVIFDYYLHDRISAVAGDSSAPDLIAPKTQGLFLVEYYGPTQMSDGSSAPVFILVDHIRL